MYLPKYLLSCDRVLVVYTSDRFFVGYLERFITCASVKNVTGNYWLKTQKDIVFTTSENISNPPLKGTNKQEIQLMNKAMYFSVQVKGLDILYDYFLFKYKQSM